MLNFSNGSKSEEQQQQHAHEMLKLTEDHQGQVQDLIENRHVPGAGDFDTIVFFVEKNQTTIKKGWHICSIM